MVNRDCAWPMPCHRSASVERAIHPGCLQNPLKSSPSRRKTRNPVSPVSVPGPHLPCPGFRGIQNRRTEVPANPSWLLRHRCPIGIRQVRNRPPTEVDVRKPSLPNPETAPRRVPHGGSNTIPVRSPESPPRRGNRFPNQDRSKRQSSPLGSLVTVQRTHSGSPFHNLPEGRPESREPERAVERRKPTTPTRIRLAVPTVPDEERPTTPSRSLMWT